MSFLAMILSIMTALAFTGAGVAGAAMLIEPRTRGAGVALLGLVIVGALLTLLRARAGWRHPAPAIGFGLLLVAESVSVG